MILDSQSFQPFGKLGLGTATFAMMRQSEADFLVRRRGVGPLGNPRVVRTDPPLNVRVIGIVDGAPAPLGWAGAVVSLRPSCGTMVVEVVPHDVPIDDSVLAGNRFLESFGISRRAATS